MLKNFKLRYRYRLKKAYERILGIKSKGVCEFPGCENNRTKVYFVDKLKSIALRFCVQNGYKLCREHIKWADSVPKDFTYMYIRQRGGNNLDLMARAKKNTEMTLEEAEAIMKKDIWCEMVDDMCEIMPNCPYKDVGLPLKDCNFLFGKGEEVLDVG